MVRYLQSSVEEIKQKANIADIIGEDVQLSRGGAGRLKGLCPFHEERSPSFFVTPADGFYHCFGCQVSGDVFRWLADRQGMSFPEAVAYVGERVGIEPQTESGSGAPSNANERKRLTDVNESAATYFRAALLDGPDSRGREWFTSRGYEPAQAAELFGAGWAPATAGLIAHMTKLGFVVQDLIDAGLVGQRERGGHYEFFRGRPTWAIRNGLGRALGFGARRILDNDPIKGKFINTRDTEAYHKEQVLFGLDIAKRNIVKKRQAVIVEGYMDVMSSHLSGIDNAVATCGTALTSKHVAELARLVGDSGELVLMFDADGAGKKAVISSYGIVKDSSIRRVTVVSVSGGKDPDELRKKAGAEAVAALLDQREPILRATVRGMIAETRHKMVSEQGSSWGVEDRVVAADAVIPVLHEISDLAIRAEYADFAATELDLNPTDVRARAKVPQRTQPRSADLRPSGAEADRPAPTERPADSQLAVQRDAMRLMLRVPDIAQTHRGLIDPSNYGHPTARALIEHLWAWQGSGGLPSLMGQLDDRQSQSVIGILASPLPVAFDDADAYAETLQNRLMHDRVERDITALEERLANEGSIELLEQLTDLRREQADLRAKSA